MSAVITDPNLVFYADLAKHDGSVFMSDDAYGHLCTVTGATWGMEGRTYVAGTNNITVGASVDLDNLTEFTYLAWVKTNALTANQFIIAKEVAFSPANWLYISATTGYLVFDRTFGTTPLSAVASANGVVVGEWVLIGATMSSANVPSLFVNGAEVASYSTRTTGVGTLNDDSGAVFKLGNSQGNNRDFTGIYGVGWGYNRAFTPAEIQNHYIKTKPRRR